MAKFAKIQNQNWTWITFTTNSDIRISNMNSCHAQAKSSDTRNFVEIFFLKFFILYLFQISKKFREILKKFLFVRRNSGIETIDIHNWPFFVKWPKISLKKPKINIFFSFFTKIIRITQKTRLRRKNWDLTSFWVFVEVILPQNVPFS